VGEKEQVRSMGKEENAARVEEVSFTQECQIAYLGTREKGVTGFVGDLLGSFCVPQRVDRFGGVVIHRRNVHKHECLGVPS
jgi:hypothetical protein